MAYDYQKKFDQIQIEQAMDMYNCSYKQAEEHFNSWKRHNLKEYKNQLNDWVDENHWH